MPACGTRSAMSRQGGPAPAVRRGRGVVHPPRRAAAQPATARSATPQRYLNCRCEDVRKRTVVQRSRWLCRATPSRTRSGRHTIRSIPRSALTLTAASRFPEHLSGSKPFLVEPNTYAIAARSGQGCAVGRRRDAVSDVPTATMRQALQRLRAVFIHITHAGRRMMCRTALPNEMQSCTAFVSTWSTSLYTLR